MMESKVRSRNDTRYLKIRPTLFRTTPPRSCPPMPPMFHTDEAFAHLSLASRSLR